MNEMQKKELLEDAVNFKGAAELAAMMCKAMGNDSAKLGSMTLSLAEITVLHLNDYLQRVMPCTGGCRMAQVIALTVLANQLSDAIHNGDADKKAELKAYVTKAAERINKSMEPNRTVIRTKCDVFKKKTGGMNHEKDLSIYRERDHVPFNRQGCPC